MARLYQRRCAVTVDLIGKDKKSAATAAAKNAYPALRIEDLRVSFKIEKSIRPEPNTSEIQVFNLNEDHRGQIQKKGLKVILEGGYEDGTTILFAGDARTVDQIRQGPLWISKIQCGDGERAYRWTEVSDSFSGSISLGAVVARLTSAMGVDPGHSAEVIAKYQHDFPSGYAYHGSASTELSRILRGFDLHWSIQDGVLQILEGDKPAPGVGPLISADTGMVDSPSHGTPKKPGLPPMLKVKTLLDGRLKPGGKFQLDSRSAKGAFRIEKLTHSGDTAGGDWYTELEALPI